MLDKGDINKTYPPSAKQSPSKYKSSQRDTFTSSERSTLKDIFDSVWPAIAQKKNRNLYDKVLDASLEIIDKLEYKPRSKLIIQRWNDYNEETEKFKKLKILVKGLIAKKSESSDSS